MGWIILFGIFYIFIYILLGYQKLKERKEGIEYHNNYNKIDDIFKYTKIQDKKDYINSKHWKILRDKIIHRDNNTCQVCGYYGSKLQVHHLTYDNLYKEKFEDLATLCNDCHSLLHEDLGYFHEKDYPINIMREAFINNYSNDKREVLNIYNQIILHLNKGKEDNFLKDIPNTKEGRKKSYQKYIEYHFSSFTYLSTGMINNLLNSLLQREKKLKTNIEIKFNNSELVDNLFYLHKKSFNNNPSSLEEIRKRRKQALERMINSQ